MKRRIVLFLLAIIQLLSLSACVNDIAADTQQQTSEETTEMTNIAPVYDVYNLDTYMSQLFKSDTVVNETVMFVGENDRIPLLYTPEEILSVRSYDLKTEYKKGVDYDYVDGALILLPGTSVKYITEDEFYGADSTSLLKTKHNGEDVFTYWGEGDSMVKWQLAVTYTHKDTWAGFSQKCESEQFEKLLTKMKNGEDVTIIFYGDSITYGSNSSYIIGLEPYMPSWPMLFTEYLSKQYGYTVHFIDPALEGTAPVPEDISFGTNGTLTYINPSVGGWSSSVGLSKYEEYVSPFISSYGCDMLVLAFGMNDGGSPAKNLNKYIKLITDKFTQDATELELLLVSTMVPNPEAVNGWYGKQETFESAFQELAVELRSAGTNCAVACMTSTSLSVLEHKRFRDYTGNNINHPNDFMSRLYAQNLFQTVYGYENITASN